MPSAQAGEEAGLGPRRHRPARRHRGRRPAHRHLGAVGAQGGRGRVAGGVGGVGPEDVGAGRQLRHRRGERRLAGGLAGLQLGRQLSPVLGVDPAVGDRSLDGTRVRVGDGGEDRGAGIGGVARLEGDPRRHVVEAQWDVKRRGGRVVARFVAQPEMERVDAGRRDRAVRERGDADSGRQLDAAVVAGGAGDPPEGAADRARRRLVGVGPGEIEVVDATPGLAAEERQRARMGRRVVVDPHRLVRRAADVAGEVGDAVVDGVRAVAEAGGVEREAAGGPKRAGLHLGRPPLAADQRLRAGILGQVDAGAVEQGFAEADAAALLATPDTGVRGAAPPAAVEQLSPRSRPRAASCPRG